MSYTIDMNDLQHDLKTWTEKQFPSRTMDSILNHCKKEIEELRNAPDDIYEFADCFMLLVDAASYRGIYMSDIWRAMSEKLEINKQREWGEPNEQGFVEHVKRDDEAKQCEYCQGRGYVKDERFSCPALADCPHCAAVNK